MSTYVVGDIQGCYVELQQLLEICHFNPTQDFLWSTGDLVNRGPNSLEVLRFFKQLDDRAIVVLGNHDLHLLAVAYSHSKHQKSEDTLSSILKAPDANELLTWLRHRPFLYYDTNHKISLIHAGLPPQWNIEQAVQYAGEAEAILRGSQYQEFLVNHLYGNKPEKWSNRLKKWDRLRFITNCFTRLRYCTAKGKLVLKKKGNPQTNQHKEQPWFKWTHRASYDTPIVFGHWATLGYYKGYNVYGIDTGCVWGGALTILRLEDKQTFTLTCKGARTPPSLK